MADVMTDLRRRLREVWNISRASAVLGWDELTYMPPGGAQDRGEQEATLDRLAHECFTSDETGKLLARARAAGIGRGEGDDDVIVRVTEREYERARALPPSLVEERSRLAVAGHEAWVKARRANDFAIFAPTLKKVVETQREVAHLRGPALDPYTALLTATLPGFTADEIERLFDDLKRRLVPLVGRITAHADRVDPAPSSLRVDDDRQWQASLAAMRAVGYDFGRGRLDRTIHPFETSFGTGDVRITTRVDEDQWEFALFSSLHEMGHGLYEQGLPARWQGTPAGESSSSAIHESQSRFFENVIGRSRPFWEFFWPTLREIFPPEFARFSLEEMYRAVNRCGPTLIRTEADEVTYNLHVILRFEIERGLLAGTMEVNDVPRVWRDRMTDLLGVAPEDDLTGPLQDVHWSGGSFASFPSYTLGNVISGQLRETVRAEIPDLDALIRRGAFAPITGWLRENIYDLGAAYETKELVRHVTGHDVEAGPYLAYLEEKFSDIYDL